MSDNKVVVGKIREALLDALQPLVREALEEAAVALRNSREFSMAGKTLHGEILAVLERFRANLTRHFDALTGEPARKTDMFDYGSLSLVEEDDLETIIAMEGMVAYTRNCDISEALAFAMRLDSLFYGTRVDESNNPMDPEQVGDSFTDAMRPVTLPARALLAVYRQFNSKVFHGLEAVLAMGNALLVENGVMPKLDMAARSKEEIINKRSQRRERSAPNDRAFAVNQGGGSAGGVAVQSALQFSVIQQLLHAQHGSSQGGGAPGTMQGDGGGVVSGVGLQPGIMIGGRRVEMVGSDALLQLLDREELSAQVDSALQEGRALDLGSSIGNVLESSAGGKQVRAVDSASADVITLVTLLFETIWEDDTVPGPIKGLIGRTQMVVLKIALKNSGFFENPAHPARRLLNEIAACGISWTDAEKLEDDPVYQKLRTLVTELLQKFDGEEAMIESMLEKFLAFKEERARSEEDALASLKGRELRRERLHEVKAYALHKIKERILEQNTPAFVQEFLEQYFHSFLVELILREGPGGNSWKPVMNTIDVLLWTVQPNKEGDDRERFERVNPRLMINLDKSLQVAGVERPEAATLLERLKEIQEESFTRVEPEADEPPVDFEEWMADAGPSAGADTPLPAGDEHLQEVSRYPLGIWVEFAVDARHSVRCTLAAHIKSIDKFVFVNGQGVKVVERSRMSLARELKAGTLKEISNNPLIDRAMEAVLSRLRQQNTA